MTQSKEPWSGWLTTLPWESKPRISLPTLLVLGMMIGIKKVPTTIRHLKCLLRNRIKVLTEFCLKV